MEQGESVSDDPDDAVESARNLLVGRRITAVSFVHDFIEVHFDEVILTGYTEPFGHIMCTGAGPFSIPKLIGQKVEHFEFVTGRYVAIDSGENRLAFPLDEESRSGPEAVRLYEPAHSELGSPARHWIW
jgi:hypothetical protein